MYSETVRMKEALKPMMAGVHSCQIMLIFGASFVLLSALGPQVSGVVEIVEQNTPQLFEVGQIMELKCISNEQEGLHWARESSSTKWKEEDINIELGSGWEERYYTIRPKGYVENMLVRRNLQSGDGGHYFCYDVSKEHSFSTFVHVLKVSYMNVTVHNSTTDSVTLTCQLSGFTTNPPRIDHSWVRNDRELVPGGRPDKYEISTTISTTLKLEIFNPTKEDTGGYVCNFILYYRSGEYVIYDETVYLNADQLDSGGVIIWSPFNYLVTLLCWIVCCISL